MTEEDAEQRLVNAGAADRCVKGCVPDVLHRIKLWSVAGEAHPKYAAWLNLIEPWWKILKALALKGRRFETTAELETALRDALAYWNAHRHPFYWRKLPQQQPTTVLGAYGASLTKLAA